MQQRFACSIKINEIRDKYFANQYGSDPTVITLLQLKKDIKDNTQRCKDTAHKCNLKAVNLT